MATDRYRGDQPDFNPHPGSQETTRPNPTLVAKFQRLLATGDFENLVLEFEQFPKYHGPALGKENTRIATFGEGQHRVEIEHSKTDQGIKLTFFDLDVDKLEQHARSGTVVGETIEDCFSHSGATSHHLEVSFAIDGYHLQRDVRITTWNPAKSAFMENKLFHPSEAKQILDLQLALNDRIFTLPEILAKLKGKAPIRSYEDMHRVQQDTTDFPHRQFQQSIDFAMAHDPLWSRPTREYSMDDYDPFDKNWTESHGLFGVRNWDYLDFEEPLPQPNYYDIQSSRPIEQIEAPPPIASSEKPKGPSGYKNKDSEEKRSAYWKTKNATSKKNEVKAKHAQKKKK